MKKEKKDKSTYCSKINKRLNRMGAYLDKPIEEKNPEPGKNDICAWGACAM